ncbi:MAG: signal peptide peptidase SppA [Spirochaetaceae bacterium]|nr:signal peptide peptidase SppA [Spirochaetaceae bacterium]
MSDNFDSNNKELINSTIENSNTENKKEKKQKNKGMIILIIILVVAFLFGFAKGFFSEESVIKNKSSGSSKYIAELYIEGTIQEENESYNQAWLLDTINELQNDKNNCGTILFINSPGGSVYESDEVYLALKKYAEEKTLWAYFGQTAASGGYYIACSAEKIIANRNTLTGSIGVIAGQSFDLTEFMSKHGIKMNTITAGKNKNMLNIDQPLTPEQREIMQSVADECYNQFTQIVADGRKLPLETVKTLADGRIYTAQQALQNKLIDEILTYEEAKTQMNENFPDLKNLTFSEFRYTKEKNFYNFIFDMYSNAKGSTSKSNLVEKIIAEYSQMDYPAYLYVK